MKNLLLRKRRYFEVGGLTSPYQTSFNFQQLPKSFNSGLTQTYNPYANLNQNFKYGLNSDYSSMDKFQSFNNRTGNSASKVNYTTTQNQPKNNFLNSNASQLLGTGVQMAGVIAEGISNGKNNVNNGLYDTQKGQFDFTNEQASNVGQSYSAGQTQLNLLSKTGPAATAKDLKTHKGWKNVLGTAGKGAAIGATVGNLIPIPGVGALIGGAVGGVIGAAAAGIGELFGKKKRERRAQQLAEAKRAVDYDVDYYNSRQAEQLASANDQAAKIQADNIRRSAMALAAFGGKLRRKNYLLNR